MTAAIETAPEIDLDAPIWEECWKCSGTGSVSWGMNVSGLVGNREVPQVCFTCNGVGGKNTTQRKLDRNAKARERYASKKEIERLERLAQKRREATESAAETDAAKAAYAEQNPEVVAALKVLDGEFGESLRSTFDSTGALSANQAAAAVRIAAEKAAEPEATAVIEGRIKITGKVVTIKWQDSAYGGSLKMLVLDDRGFKVWGTVPSALDAERGQMVAFTATVKASGDDETFGFYKRPSGAVLLDA